MIILAIETSCDDTGVAILKVLRKKKPSFAPLDPESSGFQFGDKKSVSLKLNKIPVLQGGGLTGFVILSNIVSSQIEVHKKWGGVYPSLAKREHQKNLPLVLKKALNRAKNPKIDLIAVTSGPGLEPCLWVGVNFAKDLAKRMNLPIIFVNHIEAHIYANWLNQSNFKSEKYLFPIICLIVSGGHTQIVLMEHYGKYKILGETRDDAAGECFDKVARILGLGYPGGLLIEKYAASKKNTKNKIQLPRPMIYQKNYDFSFSGLKTAVLYDFKNQPKKIKESILQQGSGLTLSEIEVSKDYIQAMAKETQQAIIDVLIKKTLKAAKNKKAKTIMLGGGVASNKELRKQFKNKIKKELPNVQYITPNIRFCTDNAAIIAITAYYNMQNKRKAKKNIGVNANLRLQ